MNKLYILILTLLIVSCETPVDKDKYLVKSKSLYITDTKKNTNPTYIYTLQEGYDHKSGQPTSTIKVSSKEEYKVGDSIMFISKERLEELKKKERYYNSKHVNAQEAY